MDDADVSLAAEMERIGLAAKAAAAELAHAAPDGKHAALVGMAEFLWTDRDGILAANHQDVAAATERGLSGPMLDRLTLTEDRIQSMIDGVRSIAEQPDPVGRVTDSWTAPSGLEVERVSTPIGVVGIIYESRPNVTADAGALCLKSGNAAILRGGSESFLSASAIHNAFGQGFTSAGLPAAAIQRVPFRERAAVCEMLTMTDHIDGFVPRGCMSVVGRSQSEAKAPVFAHLEVIVHLYIHPSADLAMALEIVLNAKTRRTSICGALECLLVDRAAVESHGRDLVAALVEAGVEVRADEALASDKTIAATAADWGKEHLDMVVSARAVDGLDGAVAHIATHGSNHTDGIIAEDASAVERFFERVDSAIVMHNASTQFADGAEFGMGAEIGIATGKLHARGPVGADQLTTFKYRVRGGGRVRP